MADSEKVQDQQQPPPSLKQKHQIQNHSDGVNGESTPDSVIQPKQTIGEWNIFRIYDQARCVAEKIIRWFIDFDANYAKIFE